MASADPSAVDAALLRRMLDESRTVTLLVDASGRVLFASAGLVDVLGVTAEAMLGQNVVDWLHPDDVPRAISSLAINDAATGLRYFPIVFRVLHAQGHAVEVDVLTSLFVLDDGSHGVLLSVRDADDRTHFVEPIRALAAGADHARVLELIASGVGRGGHVLRPAFVATTMDPTGARFTQLHAACADAPLEGALLELLASDDGASLTGLAPRELRSYPVHDMHAAVGRVLRAHGADGLRAGAITVDSRLEAVLLSVEPSEVWAGGAWMPSLRDHWLQLLDLATVAIERHRAQTLLVHAATHDGLTGLPNRVHFFDQLERMSTRDDVAVLYLDLDRFKAVNDAHGHFCGDAVLVEVAQRLRLALRPGDLVARLGGDEFGIAVAERADSRVGELAQRLHAAITAPLPANVRVGSIGVSIGLARLRRGRTVEDVVRRADEALLTAKRSGRNAVVRSPDQ